MYGEEDVVVKKGGGLVVNEFEGFFMVMGE